MKDHFRKWWLGHLTVIGAVIGFFNPSVQAWISAHAGSAVVVGGAWSYILHLAQSPLQK